MLNYVERQKLSGPLMLLIMEHVPLHVFPVCAGQELFG
jgi:hypothetical protein